MRSVLDSLDVTPDLTSGGWQLSVDESTFTVRPWTWGERQRLLAACLQPGPVLDPGAFVDGLAGLLIQPAPDRTLRDLLVAATLRLCGAVPGDTVPSLLEAEARLAVAWGWGPAELDGQPAPRIDEHVRALPVAPPTSAGGWNSIVVAGDDA